MTVQGPRLKMTSNPARVAPATRRSLMQDPGFGRVFTDHMVTIEWSEDRGWHDAKLGPRQPFQIDPACAVLHYAQEIFEGLKAYRRDDGAIALFRPEENARRFNESARRMAMPALPEATFIEAVETLIRVDQAWTPEGDGSLYVRPFMFASETFLGVRPSARFTFCVIASPVGPYFKGGPKALTVWVSDVYSRAGPGGTGAAKCAGNYAASIAAQADAARNGCDQVVFLDACARRWVEELGGMNIFFVFDDGSITTPPLGGTILPGITRASLIKLARANGLVVREEPYAMDQWREDAASQRLREVFACGTAATVTPIGRVKTGADDFLISDGAIGAVTASLRDHLLGIQRGALPDEHGWVRLVD